MKKKFIIYLICILAPMGVISQTVPPEIVANWNKEIRENRTYPTLQVVVNPMLKRGSPIHDGTFKALKDLGDDYVRFVPWFPYPYAAVPEIKAPTKTETFWDFSHIDPIVEDFMDAQKGHSVVMNFSTIPVWLFRGGENVKLPSDPDEPFWAYNVGTELRDPTFKEVADYYGRLFSWYTQGGFTDELGKFHKSDYHYFFDYWEVLNEVQYEHYMTPEFYTKLYDAVVERLHEISPKTKFMGLALGSGDDPAWFEYFLNPKNHKKGIPINAISYHFYARPNQQDNSLIDNWQYSFFNQANDFLIKVRFIENIRKRLNPNVITDLDELGVINGGHAGKEIEGKRDYWNLAGALYAYLYGELSKIGIEILGESQLVGYPSQFPSVSMMNWENSKPNARYWVLRLLHDNFGPGDQLVETRINSGEIYAQGYATKNGKKILVVNKVNKYIKIKIPPEFVGRKIKFVDINTGDDPYATKTLADAEIYLAPFSVGVIE